MAARKFTRFSGIFQVFIVLVIFGGPVVADTLHVPGDYPTIQGAMNAAVDGDEIVVAPGTYNELVDFLSKAVTLRSSDGPEVTIISGAGLDGSVLVCRGVEGGAMVAGLTIREGTGSQESGLRVGGGLLLVDSQMTLDQCQFLFNEPAGFGSNNWGGAIYARGSTLNALGCVFEDNTAADPIGYAGSTGGAVAVRGGEARFERCQFARNFCAGDGGALVARDGAVVTLIRCRLDSNRTRQFGEMPVHPGQGGGCAVQSATLVAIDTAFINNRSTGGGEMEEARGGAIYAVSGSNVELERCRLQGNYSYGSGGGIYSAGDRLAILNCVIDDNWCSYDEWGGGVCGLATESVILNTTFVNNGTGGNLRNGSNGGLIANSCFRNAGEGEIFGLIDSLQVINCNIEGGFDGEGNIDVDPLFVDAANGDYRLSSGSPCIDAGNNTLVDPDITIDLDGNPRFMDDAGKPDLGVGDDRAVVDMGAYEFQSTSYFALTVTPTPIPAGGRAHVLVTNAQPSERTWLLYSITGTGPTPIPQLDISVDLSSPRLISSAQTTNANGNTAWLNLPVPPLGESTPVWLQAVQYGEVSNLIATRVAP